MLKISSQLLNEAYRLTYTNNVNSKQILINQQLIQLSLMGFWGFGGYASFTPESNTFGELLTSNIILVILGEYPDPPIPYPPRPP